MGHEVNGWAFEREGMVYGYLAGGALYSNTMLKA